MSQQSTDRLSAVRQFVAAENLDRLVGRLHQENAACRGDWTLDGGGLVRLLQGMPVESRVRLLVRLSGALEEKAVHAPLECRGLAALNVLLAQGLSAEELAPWREPLLAEAAGRMAVWEGWRLTALLEADHQAGRALPAAVVATARRSALIATVPAELSSFVGEFAGPPVNPGEPWADRVLADLAEVRDAAAWRRLIEHAVTVTGAKPTVKWLRAGQSLLDEVGPDRLAGFAAGWFPLAGQPRRDAVVSFHRAGPALYDADPYNWCALQGLSALLGLTPARPESSRALGSLAEAALFPVRGLGPRSPLTATAAVRALGALGGPDARDELERLAGVLAYKSTLKAIAAALADWEGRAGEPGE
ncbi:MULTISPECIES: hypothetical protein [Kitasatospora]|uniref:Uncharacterized protein n=1 Tax=Kitasatospora setae (strain ATCC 33774 / DSM 43861 / JCM 3304 / KCC A-0304 / NBRC 14216 / KM-6054) TaxID=452652 RepID=E4N1A6_KITSK|nr:MULTISPECIES: hypothetical protein [Kitasatospora]BAJ31940.1 hypothetical protein KSE_61750 [Kitasatospora setae KM-6054]